MAGLYFHIPFCKRICAYCDFYKSARLEQMDGVTAAMHRELDERQDYLRGEAVTTRYFGGGTPSLYAPAALKGLLDHAALLFDCSGTTETTLEANPDDLTENYLDGLREAGIDRLSIGIQSFDDGCLKLMNRRGTGAEIRALFDTLRRRIPGLVLRTSIIAGLPGEGEAEFEELCDFLREEKIERAGVFPFSPEEGTKAATMEHVPMEEAQRRTELLVDVQSDIIDEYNESVLGDVREVLCEGWSEEAQSFVGRSYAESVDIDGKIYFTSYREIMAGEFVNVRLTGTMDGELTGELAE